MGKTDNYYIVLIHKQLTGILTPEETGELALWAKASAKNEALRQNLHTIWSESQTYASDFQPDVAVATANIKARVKKGIALEEKTLPNSVSVVAISNKKRISWFSTMAAATVLLTCGFFLWFYAGQDKPTDWVVVNATEVDMEHLLPDGSTVWLNKHTTLKYAPDFAKNNRRLTLGGEAFFAVLKSDGMKFIVETPYMEVTVLGTRFGVKANPEDNFTEIDVVSGKVAVAIKADDKEKKLAASTKARYEHNSHIFKTSEEREHLNLKWHAEQFNFKGKPFGEVAEELEAYFGIKIEFSNPLMKSCTYTSLLTEKNIDFILNTIKTTMKWQVQKINSKKYKISGEGC